MNNVKLHIDTYDGVEEAVTKCLEDMYAISQPPLNLKAYLEEVKKNPELKKETIWDKHYLPQKIYTELEELYLCKYHLNDVWKSHADLCIDYLKEGGTKDKYIEDYTDENGNWHPGYRGYAKVPALETVIGKELSDLVIARLEWCKDYYRGNQNELAFRFNVGDMGPTSNPKTVIEYQHSIGNTDFTIDEDFDPWKEDEDWDLPVVED